MYRKIQRPEDSFSTKERPAMQCLSLVDISLSRKFYTHVVSNMCVQLEKLANTFQNLH